MLLLEVKREYYNVFGGTLNLAQSISVAVCNVPMFIVCCDRCDAVLLEWR